MNRIESIGSGDANARYDFLGAGAVAALDDPRGTDGLGLSYDPNANGLYEGLDRLGRAFVHGWPKTSPALVHRFTCPYDRAGQEISIVSPELLEFLKKIGRILGRDVVPKKPGPTPKKKTKDRR